MSPEAQAAYDAYGQAKDRWKARAGYGPEDTPCEPRRSAYTSDSDGEAAYLTALQRWRVYLALAEGN